MGIFDRFRRNRQDDSVLPAEVNEYYETEQRDRRGVAVLLGIITLIITLLIAAGLFLAGRAVYRSVTKDDKPKTVQTESKNKDDKQGAAPAPADTKPTGNGVGGAANGAEPNPSGSGSTPSTPSPASPAPSGSATVPSTGEEQTSETSLPRTGDDGM